MTIWHATDVAKFLGVPVTSVYSYAKRGTIPAVKIGKHWMFNKEEVEWLLTRDGWKWYSTVGLLDSNLNKPEGGRRHVRRKTKRTSSRQ